MNWRRYAAATLFLINVGCARPAAPAGPGLAVPHVSVLPPNNRTGDPLLVAGTSMFEKYALHSERVTVADVLASEARIQLTQRGFTVLAEEEVDAAVGVNVPEDVEQAAKVAARGGLDGAALYVEIRRWEADAPTHPAFVIVGLQATLVDVASGQTLWSATRRAAPVATPGVVVLGDAYITAARKAVAELLASLVAAPPAQAAIEVPLRPRGMCAADVMPVELRSGVMPPCS